MAPINGIVKNFFFTGDKGRVEAFHKNGVETV